MTNLTVTKKSLPVICGIEITTDAAGRFNLNALHKASGGRDAKRPKAWLTTKQAQELIDELRQDSAFGEDVIKITKGGIAPGTFAHELLAIEYAGWISPSFRLQVNQTFLDFKAGKLQAYRDPMEALNDPELLRGTLLVYTEKVIALKHQVEEMQPDVEALDRIAKAEGSMCITNAAKILQVQPKYLFRLLSESHWIYRRTGGRSWLPYQDKIQSGVLESKVTTVTRSDGSEKVVEQVLITPKGITKLAKMIGVSGVAA